MEKRSVQNNEKRKLQKVSVKEEPNPSKIPLQMKKQRAVKPKEKRKPNERSGKSLSIEVNRLSWSSLNSEKKRELNKSAANLSRTDLISSTITSPRTQHHRYHLDVSSQQESELRNSLSRREDLNYQGLLHSAVIGMMSLLLQYTASRTMYNKSQSLLNSIDIQAESLVEEELTKLLDNSQSDIMTAYSQLSSKLVSEIKSSIIAHPDREKIYELSDNLDLLRLEAHRTKSDYAEIIARKEQEIEGLRAERMVVDAKNEALIAAVELLERDLQSSRMAVTDLQQEKMALKMKCAHYKGEVDRLALEIQKGVKNKIGFLPRNVDQSLNRLVNLPLPIDDKAEEEGAGAGTRPRPRTRSTSQSQSEPVSPSHFSEIASDLCTQRDEEEEGK